MKLEEQKPLCTFLFTKHVKIQTSLADAHCFQLLHRVGVLL